MRAQLLAVVAALSLSSPVLADNITLVVADSNPFNTINLFMSPGTTFGPAPPPASIGSMPSAPWTGTVGGGGLSLQLQTLVPASTSTLVGWNQTVFGAANYQLLYQVGVFDGSTFNISYSGQTTVASGGVGLIAPVPEPSSLLLCGLGLGGLGLRAWRRRTPKPTPVLDGSNQS